MAAAVSGESAFAGLNHGTLCTAHNSNTSGLVYNQYGVGNESGQAALVHCGGAKLPNAFWTVWTATVYDRSPSDDVRCGFYLTGADGNIAYAAYPSTGGFSSGSMTLAAQIPPQGGAVDVDCWLPARDPSNGTSHFTTYDIP